MYRVREQTGCSNRLQRLYQHNKVTIAVLDTGVAKHPDLKGRIVDFCDFVDGKQEAYDDSGHGTHVCGIACGNGKLSDGRYCGMAPQAELVVGKVLDKKGDGDLYAMLKGVDWVMANKEKRNIRILNVSVGVGRMLSNEKGTRLKAKLEEAWKAGLVVVCAAGNNGPEFGTLSIIGSSPEIITVGCHDGRFYKDKANRCATYSGREDKFATIRKPDIVAPGTEIVSCNAGFIRKRAGYRNAYIAKSGTSMATPIVSGALALLLQKYPDYENETVKQKLLFSATDLEEPWYQQGWGMINVERMLE